MSAIVGPQPCVVKCPNCHRRVRTSVEYSASTKTHLLAILLCIFGLWPCACCLYCTKCARNVDHYCPLCHAFVGVYER